MQSPALPLLLICFPLTATDVLTHHNDCARTGAVLDEKILSPATVKSEAFGTLFSFIVDGQIYAQPLIATGIEVHGKGSNLTPIDWFAPANVEALNLLDIDLGSAGPMLLPDTHELIGGGKEGKLYLISRSKLGGQQQRHWLWDQRNPPIQFFQAGRWPFTWLSWFPLLFNTGYHHIHGSPVYWRSRKGAMIYVWPEEDHVKAFSYDPQKKFNTKPRQGMMGNKGMPGGFLSISANGQEDGILWAAIPCCDDAYVNIVRGSLRAFDASTLELIWSSDRDEPADYFDHAKYVPPTVANGKVYLATFSDRLNVYGLDSPFAVSGQRPAPKVSKDPRHRGHVPGASGHRAPRSQSKK